MLYHFNQSLHVAGKDFPRGNHEVPEKCENHPHFLKYVGLGWVTEVAPVEVITAQSQQAKGAALLDRLVKKADAKKAKESVPEVPADPQPPVAGAEVSPPVDDDGDDEKPKGKVAKKPR